MKSISVNRLNCGLGQVSLPSEALGMLVKQRCEQDQTDGSDNENVLPAIVPGYQGTDTRIVMFDLASCDSDEEDSELVVVGSLMSLVLCVRSDDNTLKVFDPMTLTLLARQ